MAHSAAMKMTVFCCVICRYAYHQLGMWFPFYFVMLALTCAALAYILILFVSYHMLFILHSITHLVSALHGSCAQDLCGPQS